MQKQITIIWLFFAGMGTALASGTWTVEKLFKLVSTSTGDKVEYRFTEVRKMAFLRKPMQLRGLLIYVKPDKIEKKVEYPETQQFTIVGNRLTIRREGKKTRKIKLTNYPELQVLSESLRAALSGQLAVLKKYYTLELKGTRLNWKLVLTPTDIDIVEKIETIEIQGKEAKLTRILIQKVDADQSILTVTPR